MSYDMNNKINSIKDSRSLSIDGIVTLERNIVEAQARDDFNASFLFNDHFDIDNETYDPAVMDLILLYYKEIHLEDGTTFEFPTIGNYTKEFWENLLIEALNPNGDGIFYPYIPGYDVSKSLSDSGINPNEMGSILGSVTNKVDKVPSAGEDKIAVFDDEGGIKSGGKTLEEILGTDIGGLINKVDKVIDATEDHIPVFNNEGGIKSSGKSLTSLQVSQTEAEDGVSDGVEENYYLWSPEKVKDSIYNLSHYRHDQDSPSDIWIIEHSLEKNPSVSVVESTDNEEIFGKVTYEDLNTVKIKFSIPITGIAYLN